MPNAKHWLLATRPKTLPAGIVPVLLGSSIAYSEGKLNWLVAVLALICSLLIQIITNFINEIYDFKKGADTAERKGPQRMVASGIISPKQMAFASALLGLITFGLGLIIVANSDYYILAVGLISLFFAWLYTGGPYPLAYNGLGDVFVFVFFGLVAVCGSYYAQTLSWNWLTFIAAIAPGLLSMNILGVNNYRDIDTDKVAGKRTLSVKIGKANAILMYQLSLAMAFIVPIAIFAINLNLLSLLPLILIPIGLKLIKSLKTKVGIELNEVLAGSGKLVFLHGILTSIGFLIRW